MPTDSTDDRVGEVKTVVEVPLPVLGFVFRWFVDRLTAVFGEFVQKSPCLTVVISTGHIVLLE